MSPRLRITVRFLQPYCHARRDDDTPEWPPSPMRLFQALVNAAAARFNQRQHLTSAADTLAWLESLPAPDILAPDARPAAQPYSLYVPNNAADLVAAAWAKGKFDASIAEHRAEKVVYPSVLPAPPTEPASPNASPDDDPLAVHYLYPLPDTPPADLPHHVARLRDIARAVTHLGWGIDLVAADADLLQHPLPASPSHHLFRPVPDARTSSRRLRVPLSGSLNALVQRHTAFLHRLQPGPGGKRLFVPPPPFTRFNTTAYLRDDETTMPRPFVAFRLIDANDDTVAFSQRQLIALAGMVRHLAIHCLTQRPPRNIPQRFRHLSPEQFIEQYIAGHALPAPPPDHTSTPHHTSDPDNPDTTPHAQLSYLPLQSVGHRYTNPSVRRVLITTPPDALPDEADLLESLARLLDLQPLRPDPKSPSTFLPPGTRLQRIHPPHTDGVCNLYTAPTHRWASTTPLILPGHDDHNPDKTRRLILKSLAHAQIDTPCTFTWSAHSAFPKCLSAHKYTRDPHNPERKHPTGYRRPDHLAHLSAVHVQLTFDRPVHGPLALGAGRHCGLGVLAHDPAATPPATPHATTD
ncbi:MAG: type I-U CRISPR-associated protein Csb2 [Tepidisphaerales bacterium]